MGLTGRKIIRMFGLFKKKKTDYNIYAPVDGNSIAIENVADKVFASKMLGDGLAFVLEGDKICAPCHGTITTIADTKHAFGIKMHNGMEVLVHVGLDTVNLKGQGFQTRKQVNDKVNPGDVILELNLDIMREHGVNLTTLVIITNDNGYEYVIAEPRENLKAGSDQVIIVS